MAYLDLARREADIGLRTDRLERAAAQRDLTTVASIDFDVGIYATPEGSNPSLSAETRRLAGFAIRVVGETRSSRVCSKKSNRS